MAFLILLIEDNDDIRENTVELLELEGYRVLAAGNGSRALELIAQQVPHVIICDVVMPGISGYDVFSSLQNDARTSSIPFVFATARSERSDLVKAFAQGIQHYLIKPYDSDELMRCIKACLNSC